MHKSLVHKFLADKFLNLVFSARSLGGFALLCLSLAVYAQPLRMLVQSSPLAGYQFHAGSSVWQQLKVGDALTLVREPGNAHDGNAIRVEWQGQQLGYLPRTENVALAAAMDKGTPVEARISALREARNPWQRVRIDVFVALL